MYRKWMVYVYTLASNVVLVLTLPQQKTMELHGAVENFQNAIQRQTFQSVLNSIEERLRNLDNIYSMQLSETLKSKLDQYHRKLESLDKKIIQLESILMLNLDKISENISTKNYRDDIVKTHIHRKLDNMYDNLNYRLSYMDKKQEMAFEKLQSRVDIALHRLEKMEEGMLQRHADMENEFSDTQLIIEELKASISNSELLVHSTNNILNYTLENSEKINAINKSIEDVSRKLNNILNIPFGEIQNATMKILNVSVVNIDVLMAIRSEFKEDYNNYANKVADMNIDIWKRNDNTDDTLRVIEAVVNSTKTEVQNGVRALMLQIGKMYGKESINNDKILESLKKNMDLSFEKILSNQGLFLESCHRVQMDESQIETEIGAMLEKLLDMLEKKMTTVMKDLKNLEKIAKGHDSKMSRNLYQSNTNIVALYEKTVKHHQSSEHLLQDIKFFIDSLFTFVQNVLTKNDTTASELKDHLSTITKQIFNLDRSFHIFNYTVTSNWNEFMSNLTKYHATNQIITNNSSKLSNCESYKQYLDSLIQMNDLLQQIKPNLLQLKTTNSSEQNSTTKKKCLPNYLNLIDVRLSDDNDECYNESTSVSNNSSMSIQSTTTNNATQNCSQFDVKQSTNCANKTNPTSSQPIPQKKKCLPNYLKLIDVRLEDNEECDSSDNTSEPTNTNSHQTLQNVHNGSSNLTAQLDQHEKTLEQEMLEIFGKPPPLENTSSVKVKGNQTKTEKKSPNKKKKCVSKSASSIDSNARLPICKEPKQNKKTKKKKQNSIKSRFNYEESEEVTENDEFETTTETLVDTTLASDALVKFDGDLLSGDISLDYNIT